MKFLFDLGGVFFDWDPKHFFNNTFSSSEELDYFLSIVCNDEWNVQQDAGRTIKEAEEEIIPKFPQYEKQIKMYYANHRKMIKGVFFDSIEILDKLKKNNYFCYVLSNWSAETFVGMTEDYPFLKQFDGLLISGQDNLIKPDPAIYKLAIQRFDLDPEKTVFIDDKLENIETARKLNFNTIHLTNPETITININKFLT